MYSLLFAFLIRFGCWTILKDSNSRLRYRSSTFPPWKILLCLTAYIAAVKSEDESTLAASLLSLSCLSSWLRLFLQPKRRRGHPVIGFSTMCPRNKMGIHRFFIIIAAVLGILVVEAKQAGPRVDFYNYSGVDATVTCLDHREKTLQTGETFFIPYTHSRQACSVTLKTGNLVSSVVSQVLPGSTDSGLSVSVDIHDTHLFFALDNTGEHEYVSYVNLQGDAQSNRTELQLWWVHAHTSCSYYPLSDSKVAFRTYRRWWYDGKLEKLYSGFYIWSTHFLEAGSE